MTRDDHSTQLAHPRANAFGFFVGVLIGIGSIAFLAGLGVAAVENGGLSNQGLALGLCAILAASFAAWLGYRHRGAAALPLSPRMREAGLILYLSGTLGIAVAIALIWWMGPTVIIDVFLSEEAVPAAATMVLAAAFVAGMALSVRWLVLLDEHERAAHDFGTVAAFYTYLTVSGVWWLLARGGMVAPPDGVLIFWLSLVVWLAGWTWRRLR